jgi:hypothetical protein
MAVARDRGGEEVEQRVEDDRMVAEMYKLGGAFSLVGLEFYYKPAADAPKISVKLDGLFRDGETYRATDVRAGRPLEDGFHPRELRIGLRTRGPRDPVIKLLKQLKMPTGAYIDPLLDKPSNGLDDFQTPESQMRPHAEGRAAQAPMQFKKRFSGGYGGMQQGFQGRGRSGETFQRAPMSPQRPRNFSPFRQPFPQPFQPGFCPAPAGVYDPYMQMGARMESPYLHQDAEDERAQF